MSSVEKRAEKEEETEAEESKDEIAELGKSFNASMNVKGRHGNKNRIRIIKVDHEAEDETANSQNDLVKKIGVNRAALARVGQNANSRVGEESSDADEEFKKRVQRFLSVVEIPQEQILIYTPSAVMSNSGKAKTNAASSGNGFFESLLQSNESQSNASSTKNTKNVTKLSTESVKLTIVDVDGSDASVVKTKMNRLKGYRNGTGLTQEKKARIIKEIIKNYDLDAYMDKIKETSVVEYKHDKKKPELKNVRERLLKLMKSDTIRLNDRAYMRRLTSRVQDNIQRKQQSNIQKLVELEKKRERKLLLKGLIEQEYDLDETPAAIDSCSSVSFANQKTASNGATSFRLPKIKN